MHAGETERGTLLVPSFGPCLFTLCVVGPVEEIAITISTLDDTAMFMADALHHDRLAVLVALDIERTASPDGHPSGVGSRFHACWHLNAHQVASAKAVDALAAQQVATRKAEFIEPCALVAAPACGLEGQRRALPVFDGLEGANASSVEGVRFRN